MARPKEAGLGPEDTHVELLDGRSAALVGSDYLHLHDLDGVGTGTVASTHVTVCGQVVNFIDKMPRIRMKSSEQAEFMWSLVWGPFLIDAVDKGAGHLSAMLSAGSSDCSKSLTVCVCVVCTFV